MTVRNIRAHQSRGLLPAPEIRGRTGYYGAEHVTRLELIKRDAGRRASTSQAIKRLIDVSDGSGEEVLGFKRALMAPFDQESPEFIELAELNERWGVRDRKLLAKARRLGLIRPIGEGRFEVPSPTLYRAGEELLALGVEPRIVLEVAEQVRAPRGGDLEGVRRAVPRGDLEAVRGGRAARGGLAAGARGARAAAPARLRGRAGHLPARDDASEEA